MRQLRQLTRRGVAVAGNSVGLFCLVLFSLLAPPLFHTQPSEATAPQNASPARRVLLILLDGLRADTATDEHLMPRLCRLAREGSSGEATVEALIPSTIAGVRAEVEGVVAPPGAFLFDFASPGAPSGGFLEAVHAAGTGRTFVAAPRLWSDLYGSWIDEAVTSTELAGEDDQLLRSAFLRVANPEWRMIVVHFSRLDAAAHREGAASPRYRAAAAWCDAAIGSLCDTMGPYAAVVVTSDHGVTDEGGHAGREKEVRLIPVIAAGPGAPHIPAQLRQVDIASLIASALGQTLPRPSSGTSVPSRWSPFLACAGALLAAFATFRLLASSTSATLPPSTSFWLHLSLWPLTALWFFIPGLTAIGGLAVLYRFAWTRSNATSRETAIAGALGIAVAGLRIALGRPGLDSPSPSPFSQTIWILLGAGAALVAACVTWKRSGGKPSEASICGWSAFALCIIQLTGGSLSLSALKVHLAFRIAETSCGLLGAIVVAALQPHLALLLVFGLVAVLLARAQLSGITAIAACAGAVLVAELASGALIFAFSHFSQNLEVSSLALALLLRSFAEAALLFPLLAFATLAPRVGVAGKGRINPCVSPADRPPGP